MKTLQWSLRILKKVFPDGPYRAAPWRLVKCDVLFVKCRCSVRFLTACRRFNVIPRFIKNCSKESKLFGAGVTRHEERFQRIVLNRIIKEKYCRLHELRHSLHEARQAAWRSMNSKKIGLERSRLGGHDMAESSQLTSHKKQIEQDVSSDMPLTSSVVKREHRRHETQL